MGSQVRRSEGDIVSAVTQDDALAALHHLERDSLSAEETQLELQVLRRFVEERSDLTTRDQFAMAALTGSMSLKLSYGELAEISYRAAETMMLRRPK